MWNLPETFGDRKPQKVRQARAWRPNLESGARRSQTSQTLQVRTRFSWFHARYPPRPSLRQLLFQGPAAASRASSGRANGTRFCFPAAQTQRATTSSCDLNSGPQIPRQAKVMLQDRTLLWDRGKHTSLRVSACAPNPRPGSPTASPRREPALQTYLGSRPSCSHTVQRASASKRKRASVLRMRSASEAASPKQVCKSGRTMVCGAPSVRICAMKL
jgi:hypothetical protein